MADERPDKHPDWREEARRKLANSELSPDEREEISRELAGYLEDLCSDAPTRGSDDSAATQIAATRRAAAELHEDKRLGANLYRARKEHPMYLNDRTKRLWLPSVTVLVATAILSYVFDRVRLLPNVVWYMYVTHGRINLHHPSWILIPNIQMLCILPCLGAAGAYWSRREGGDRAARVAVGLFPLLALALWVFLPYGVASGHLDNFGFLAHYLVNDVAVPGIALLLGVLPFLRNSAAPCRIIP